MMALGVFVLFAGMLFWTKLRLVSDIPRTAYAVPAESSKPSPSDTDVEKDDNDDLDVDNEGSETSIDD